MSALSYNPRYAVASNIRWAMERDRTAATEPARMGLQRRFEDAVDPLRELTPAERAKRVANLKKAYYATIRQGQKFAWPEVAA